ncbi:MAG: 50S ribosomal protein L24 [Candidatus Omnitrophota bacterium]|nr:50S ribosomal protein L24 [Candidatus Omnitrophota bacterium]
MFKIRKGDIVQIITGKDRGKKGKVLAMLPEGERVLVEGLNLVKKHKRQTRQDQQGGIVSIEAPIQISNLMVFCRHCNRPVRVGFTVLKDGSKSRFCKSCKEGI